MRYWHIPMTAWTGVVALPLLASCAAPPTPAFRYTFDSGATPWTHDRFDAWIWKMRENPGIAEHLRF